MRSSSAVREERSFTRPLNFRSASYTHKEKNHDAQLSSQCFLGIVVFVDGGKNRDKCSVWLWQVTHGLQDLLARLAGVRLKFIQCHAGFVSDCEPCRAQATRESRSRDQGPGSLLLAASKAKAGGQKDSQRLKTASMVK